MDYSLHSELEEYDDEDDEDNDRDDQYRCKSLDADREDEDEPGKPGSRNNHDYISGISKSGTEAERLDNTSKRKNKYVIRNKSVNRSKDFILDGV